MHTYRALSPYIGPGTGRRTQRAGPSAARLSKSQILQEDCFSVSVLTVDMEVPMRFIAVRTSVTMI